MHLHFSTCYYTLTPKGKEAQVLKRIIGSLAAMHEITYFLMKKGMQLSCILLLCSVVVRLYAGPLAMDTACLHQYAKLMFQLSFVILLETVLGTAILEEQLRFRR